MKQKVLFCIENFQHGGINKALENILQLIDTMQVEVQIFVVNREDGPYKALFEPYIKYNRDPLLQAYCTNYRKHSGLRKFTLLALKSARKLFSKLNFDPFKYRLKHWANIISKDNFDCVIAFAEGYITEFVSNITGHKIAWIHIDYKRYLEYANNADEHHIYKKYDHIVIPSKFSGKNFSEIYPDLADRVCVIPNLVDSNAIKNKGLNHKMPVPEFTADAFTIVSVGRICHEKGFTKIPNIAKQFKQMGGYYFKWYIIGDGSALETSFLRNKIQEADMADHIKLLGRKDNPYPYIAKADLLVSTSVSETFSYVVFEAKSLGTPIICSDFGTASEILTADEGIITSIDNMASEIYQLYSNPSKLKTLAANLSEYNYNNRKVLSDFMKIIKP